MLDFIIVGSGLAGLSFAETALQNHCSVHVFDSHQTNASTVAGGLYNPVILKRFTKAWQANRQLPYATQFYQKLELKLGVSFYHEIPILRRFHSVEEQNNWFLAADQPELAPYLSSQLIYRSFKGLQTPFGCGQVRDTGYADVALLIDCYRAYLKGLNCFSETAFDYGQLLLVPEGVIYQNLQARHIVFAEGFAMTQNPYFSDLPLVSSKGELLMLFAPELELDAILNAGIFILPLEKGYFKVGATYNWEDQTALTTQQAREELLSQLDSIIQCPYQVINQFAGIRPTVKDRRPLLGTHHSHPQLHVLNGLGTRGVLVGPAMALDLFQHIVHGIPLADEVNIQRYYKKRGIRT